MPYGSAELAPLRTAKHSAVKPAKRPAVFVSVLAALHAAERCADKSAFESSFVAAECTTFEWPHGDSVLAAYESTYFAAIELSKR